MALGIDPPETTDTLVIHPNTKLHEWVPNFLDRH